MVPKGWTYSTLEGLIDIKHGFAFKSEYFTNQGQFVLLTPGHFNEAGGFRDQQEKTKYYNGVIPDGYLLTKGDLLLAMTEQAAGLLGSAAHIPEDNKYLHNQRLGLIKALSPNEIDLRFLFWLYNSPEVRKQIAEQASGTKVKHTSPGKLIGVSALIPPIAEQTKIAQILSTWDKAIATTERLLANSQQQKQALMQQLLTGQKRFASFSKSWEETTLGKICKPQQWPTISSSQLTDSGYRVFGANGFIGYFNEFNHAHETVAVTCRGSTCGEVSLIPEKAYITGNSMCLDDINPNKHDYTFIYFLLCLRGFRDVISGSAQPQIVGNAIKTIQLSIPPLPEQQKIAQVLSTADAEVANLQAQLATLKLEKKALMQQLLTGQRRVKLDAEAAA